MSDSELFREVDEDYRRERVVAFWRSYGAIIALTIALAVAAAAAYNYFHARSQARNAAETTEFEALLSGVHPGAEAASADALAAFAAQATPAQATLALLTEASLRQRAGNLVGASQIYHEIADGSSADPLLRDLAVVRLGYVASDEAKPEPLIPRLQEIAAKDSPWRYDAREAIGLLTARAGQRDQAAKMFSDLAADPGAPPDMVGRAHALAELYSGK
jgi:hypothetical protein